MKKGEITELIGFTILSVDSKDKKTLVISTVEGKTFTIRVGDEGGGSGNDSYAYIAATKLMNLAGEKLINADARDYRNDGGQLNLRTENNRGFIQIVHESNGYYGWDYSVEVN